MAGEAHNCVYLCREWSKSAFSGRTKTTTDSSLRQTAPGATASRIAAKKDNVTRQRAAGMDKGAGQATEKVAK